jgi:hypothetical protein
LGSPSGRAALFLRAPFGRSRTGDGDDGARRPGRRRVGSANIADRENKHAAPT